MPYIPSFPPQDLNDLVRWLTDELNRINPEIIVDQEFFSFLENTTAPPRPRIGQVSWADGTNWNPGAGQGLYEYTNLGWAKLGGGDGNVVPTSHSVLQDLLADDHPLYHTDARGDARYYTQPQIDSRQLDNLSDVTINNEQDGEVLTYDDGTSQWVNAAPTGGGTILASVQLDGGTAISQYLISQNVDGGGSTAIYDPADIIDGGSA